MIIIGIYFVVLFGTIMVQEFTDASERLVRVMLFIVLVPFVIVYSFFVPYTSELEY